MLCNTAIQVNLSRLGNLSLDWGGLDDDGLRRACPSHHLSSDHLWDGEGGQLGLGWSACSRWSICSKDGQLVWRWSEGWSKSVFLHLKLLRIQLYRNLVDLPCGRDDLLDNLDSWRQIVPGELCSWIWEFLTFSLDHIYGSNSIHGRYRLQK